MTLVHQRLLEMLTSVATALGDNLREDLVFVGGCTTALFITDPVVLGEVRYTDDVDLIVDLTGFGEWVKLKEELRELGFTENIEDKIICRMRYGAIKVDFMPDDEEILGFTNRWYAKGINTALTHELRDDLHIKCLTPPLFLATKLEAYLGRGNNDPLSSHDLEDILIVVDGREELVDEVQKADEDVRSFIAQQLQKITQHPDFDSFLHGNIRGPLGRVDIVSQRLSALKSE